MNDLIRYEMAQAQMEDQMRKAAIWRMQRAATTVGKQNRKNGAGSWFSAMRQAFGGKASAKSSSVESAGTQGIGEVAVVYVHSN